MRSVSRPDRDAHVLDEVLSLGDQPVVQCPAPGEQRLALLRVVGHRDLGGARLLEQRGVPLYVLAGRAPAGRPARCSAAAQPGGNPKSPVHWIASIDLSSSSSSRLGRCRSRRRATMAALAAASESNVPSTVRAGSGAGTSLSDRLGDDAQRALATPRTGR